MQTRFPPPPGAKELNVGVIGCGVVVEAIVEDLQAKKSLFGALEGIVDPAAILASNTSSLSVTTITAGLKHPERVAGFRLGPCELLALTGLDVSHPVMESIVNIACEIAQQQIADPEDIDRAVVLGLGYPIGPLAWGDRIGTTTVLTILKNLEQQTGDTRYRPSPWLQRRALLGLSLHHKEI